MKLKFILDILEADLKHTLGLEKYIECNYVNREGVLEKENKAVINFAKDLFILAKRYYKEDYEKLGQEHRYTLIKSQLQSQYYRKFFH
jgi:hypothetical protein